MFEFLILAKNISVHPRLIISLLIKLGFRPQERKKEKGKENPQGGDSE